MPEFLVILLTVTTLPLGDVKSHLSELVGRVHDHHERVTVTVHGRPSAVLIAPEDLERLEETLHICLQMWHGIEEPIVGRHYQLDRPLNSPQSLSRPHPQIVIGGSGERKTLRLVARYADACNLFPTPDMLARLQRCEKELTLLRDAIDALSDAAVAECAHQAVRGNIQRTSTTLQAIASGDAPPPQLEVARTPRTGIAVRIAKSPRVSESTRRRRHDRARKPNARARGGDGEASIGRTALGPSTSGG